MNVTELTHTNIWEAIPEKFIQWISGKENLLEPGLSPDPTMKVLIFLALHDLEKPCTYEELKNFFYKKNLIQGNIPDNTLRTSMLSLGKTLEKYNHSLQLKSSRGRFQLIARTNLTKHEDYIDPTILILHPPAIKIEDVAKNLIEKGILSFSSLYFLESSAKWWETYSSTETAIRVQYEAGAWEKLGIKERVFQSENNKTLSLIGLAPGEGLAEIELIKTILKDPDKKIHYLAIDSSPKLLRDHIGLLKEILSNEIEQERIAFAGVIADIFTGLENAVERVQYEFKKRKFQIDFLPANTGLLITYFGNCLGNNSYDQETEFFTMIQSIFQNRPLEILVGVSVMRNLPDQYVRNWDDFLLQTPRHLLETKKMLESSKEKEAPGLSEFVLPEDETMKNERCPEVSPEQYIARNQIKGQIYRFNYKLAYDLSLSKSFDTSSKYLPKGTLVHLYSIIKYDMPSLAKGIEKSDLLNVKYDPTYHQAVNTSNGIKEYAVFSVYTNKK